MTTREKLELLLAEFGRRMGVRDLALIDDACCLNMDSLPVVIEFDASEERMLVYSPLGVPDDSVELFKYLLGANLFWKKTRGATLSLDGKTGRVVLMRGVSLDGLDEPAFEAFLEEFVNNADSWRRALDERVPAPVGADVDFAAQSFMLRV